MKVLIMAGGIGERFWPLSTKEKPKQLISLISEKSMIRETVNRILNLVTVEDVFIATNLIQANAIMNELPELPKHNIIIEPMFKDTAAAIAYGSTYISKYEKDPIIIVLASDHVIENVHKFIEALKLSEKEAANGSIVTLGIKPTRPEVGYGYIMLENVTLYEATKTTKFLEKPNYETAIEYLNKGNYVWNSGMFVFKYNTIMNEINKYVPNHAVIINKIRDYINNYTGVELSEKVTPYFVDFEKISIDYAVMEKSKIIKCIPVDIGWNDVGGYNSLDGLFTKDEFGNTVKEAKFVSIDSWNNIIITDKEESTIATMGISNSIIVDSKNGILVCSRDRTSDIKELLKKINN